MYQNVELPLGNHPRNVMLVTNKLNVLVTVHFPSVQVYVKQHFGD
jgi:hypothetical protein